MTKGTLELQIGNEWVELALDGAIHIFGGGSSSRQIKTHQRPSKLSCPLKQPIDPRCRAELKSAISTGQSRKFRVILPIDSRNQLDHRFLAYVTACGDYSGRLKLSAVNQLPEGRF